jgi:hypothetical protein
MRNPRNFIPEKILRGTMRTGTVSKKKEPCKIACVECDIAFAAAGPE